MSFPEAVEELLHVPATNADRVLGQAFVPEHVVFESFDQVGIRATRDLNRLQPSKKTEPLLGVGDESPPSVPIIGCVMSVRLRFPANPSIRSCMDLLNSNGTGLLQVQVIDENQLMLCDQTERTPGATLRGTMHKIANPIFE